LCETWITRSYVTSTGHVIACCASGRFHIFRQVSAVAGADPRAVAATRSAARSAAARRLLMTAIADDGDC
jgi:hypothetical protein